jgi:hypothetical protein
LLVDDDGGRFGFVKTTTTKRLLNGPANQAQAPMTCPRWWLQSCLPNLNLTVFSRSYRDPVYAIATVGHTQVQQVVVAGTSCCKKKTGFCSHLGMTTYGTKTTMPVGGTNLVLSGHTSLLVRGGQNPSLHLF